RCFDEYGATGRLGLGCYGLRDGSGRSGYGSGPSGTRARTSWIEFALQAFEVGAKFGSALIAQVAVFFEGLMENALEFGRRLRIQRDRRDGRIVQNIVEDDGGRRAGKSQLASDKLIDHRTEGKEIATSVEFRATSLLRRHIGDGADGSA